MEQNVKDLFERYEKMFRMALKDQADMDQVTSSYATAFVAASPAGVSVGRNDEHLKQMMQQGFEHYRRIGTKDMRLRNVRIAPIDEHHCLAHVAWTAVYDRGGEPDVPLISRSTTWCSSATTRRRSSDGCRGMSRPF